MQSKPVWLWMFGMEQATSTRAGAPESLRTRKRKSAAGMPESSSRRGISGLKAVSDTWSGRASSSKSIRANGTFTRREEEAKRGRPIVWCGW